MPTNLTNRPTSQYEPNDLESYAQWFARQVDEGLSEADDPATVWVSNKQVFQEIDIQLQQLREQAPQRKVS